MSVELTQEHLPSCCSNVALVGFYGSGKTKVGQIVAKRLKFSFVNTDDLIRRHYGISSLCEVFQTHGREHYLNVEAQIVASLSNRSNSVISTGGTFIESDINPSNLKHHALIFVLMTRPDVILERIRANPDRPFLPASLSDAEIIARWEASRERYANCGLQIPANSDIDAAAQIVRTVGRVLFGR